jgi:hypothetical protein
MKNVTLLLIILGPSKQFDQRHCIDINCNEKAKKSTNLFNVFPATLNQRIICKSFP